MLCPPRVLPNLVVRRVDPSLLPDLVRLAVDAGVDEGPLPDLGRPPVADTTTTRFTVVTDTGRHQLDAYALLEASSAGVELPGEPVPGSPTPGALLLRPPDGGLSLSEPQEAARARLLDLMAALEDLPTTLGADAVSDVAPHEPGAVAAFAFPYDPRDDPEAARRATSWPGPALPGEPVGGVSEAGCVTATGDEARTVLETASSATTITPWVAGGEEWSLVLRALVPDENGRADLTG